MKSTTTRRIIRAGLVNFWRNGFVSLASVLVITVTLFVIGSLRLGEAFLSSSLTTIEAKVDVSVSFRQDATPAALDALKEKLTLLPGVTAVTERSSDEELADFRARHADNSLLLQSLEEVGNPFGPRFDIKAADPNQYESISNFLESEAGPNGTDLIDTVNFKKDIVDQLLDVTGSLRRIGWVVSIVLLILSVLVTVNTISLAIYTAREEISVMRLVGAENNYIRGPFIVEGIVGGTFAAIIAMILLYPGALWVRSGTAGIYGGVDLLVYYFSHFVPLFLTLLAWGVGLGVVSGWLAVRRYLRV